jgi:Flp pilus assembly protein TadB
MPHPYVIVTGLLVCAAVAVLGFRTAWQPEWFYAVFFVAFAFFFPMISRRSARRERERRTQMLEQKRHEKVLHLDDSE